jgi:putative SOS response-associated peptidase YedK
VAEQIEIRYYENGFDFLPGPVITPENPRTIKMFSWGLIPWWVKSVQQAHEIRVKTLNCVSEEMVDKPSFRDSLRDGKRCLIPCTGFYEWRHEGKLKYPHFIRLRASNIFSLAGLYSSWTNKESGMVYNSYTVLTTAANPLMEKIHNSKKRMPVILQRQHEGDWLNESLTPGDVAALCAPLDAGMMQAHTISKMITDRKVLDKNTPEIQTVVNYPELV